MDLVNLEVNGKLIAPGDLSVGERNNMRFHRKLMNKLDFDKESIKDILNLR